MNLRLLFLFFFVQTSKGTLGRSGKIAAINHNCNISNCAVCLKNNCNRCFGMKCIRCKHNHQWDCLQCNVGYKIGITNNCIPCLPTELYCNSIKLVDFFDITKIIF